MNRLTVPWALLMLSASAARSLNLEQHTLLARVADSGNGPAEPNQC